jgi:cysteine desulfurase
VYLDHNATSPMREEALLALMETARALAGNPSSLHRAGRMARDWLDQARERIARALAVGESEILFTSGGTEANNLALFGTLRAARRAGRPSGMVTTAVEHSSVLETARQLEREGHQVVVLPVGPNGLPSTDSISRSASEPGCGLVSFMAANNELGTRMPLWQIRDILAGAGTERPIFHIDAVQALGKSPLALREWGVDLASFSAHKVGGPAGFGVLYKRAGVELQPLLYGGGQEEGLRPGTENVPAAVAASVAIELAVQEREALEEKCTELEHQLWESISNAIPGALLAGPPLGDPARQPGTLNVVFPHEDGKVLVTRLDLAGLEVSAGSACASGSIEPSHVLLALGFDEDAARAGLRFSLGRTTTRAEIQQAVDTLRRMFG